MRHLFAFLILALQINVVRAVTCDFDYELTPPPSAVGLTIRDSSAGPVMIWYPAEPSTFKQVTDERETARMNMSDYFVAARFGAAFKDKPLTDRNRLLRETFNDWYSRGARQIQVTHMMVADMQARIDASRLKAHGVVIGTIDPALGERLAGHGLVVVNLQSSFLSQPKSQREAMVQLLSDSLAEWLGADTDKPRALIIQEEMSPNEIAAMAEAASAKTVIINHRLVAGNLESPIAQSVLAFQTDDTGDASKKSLRQLASKQTLTVINIPKLESALLSAAPYEACARLAFSREVYQGWHLHHRRTVIIAEILSHIEKKLKLDLDLAGTNQPNKALETEIGVTRTNKP
ncbi:hypothetical protein C7S18_22130 [Ahniella affigens]|uniref:TraB/GumN family protein n=1 Tax=Ahniella affigens TaxID=2021234 RepID=A0A2P1PXY6_9GAMM|nr:hypothetical protein [Ahniella affigens]AVP99706.1 hypothetical protein C7S18_22130 [Ahniella affigens]